MEKKRKKNMNIYNCVTLLYSRNEPQIVSQLYFNKIEKEKPNA